MKKILSVILCIMMCASVLISCNSTPAQSQEELDESSSAAVELETETEIETETELVSSSKEDFSDTNISYVMIYNPDIYNKNLYYNSTKTTGKISTQVVAASHRADGLTEPPAYIPNTFDASEFFAAAEGKDFEMDRADAFYAPYSVGDYHSFYTNDKNDNRVLKDFVCKYAGEYCNIWLDVNCYASDADMEKYGILFDENIYTQELELFGRARFADNGRKVNILFTDLSDGLCGFFIGIDSITMNEAEVLGMSDSGINDSHAIINVNVNYANVPGYETMIYTTIAHEFQHAICFNDCIETNFYFMPNTWLNEAMSGYVEDYLVEGAQLDAGRYDSLVESKRIRHGQSLYNFDTTTTWMDWDIGVYGSVYVFSEYVANLAKNDHCFKGLHDKYVLSYGMYPVDDAIALYSIIPQSEKERIDSLVEYPSHITFSTDENEFMSKLALDFYISSLTYDEGTDPAAFKHVDADALLYDEINSANIEGGGRIIVETKNGSFNIPEDADAGLVYVSLDNNFEVIDIVVR